MYFDDPLSALDANVSNFLMENTMCQLLKDKTRIIVTHALQFLKYADCILLMEHGEIVFSGNFEQLKKTEYLKQYQFEDKHSDVSESDTEDHNATHKKKKAPVKKEENEVRLLAAPVATEKLDPILSKFASEEKAKGSLSCSVVHALISNSGGYFVFLFIFALTWLGSLMQIYGAQYLIRWSNDYEKGTRWSEFAVYCSILYGYCTIAAFRLYLMLFLGVGYSRRAHSSMVFKVLHSQVEEFIEKVSIGRLLNRFTKDIEVLDKNIMKTATMLVFSVTMLASNCIFMVLQLDYLVIAPLVLYIFLSFFYQRYAMVVKREAVRLEAISKSPIVSWTAETMRGLPQIRCSNKLNYVTCNMVDLLHNNMSNSLLSIGLDAWYRLRISLLNIFIVQIPSYLYMLFRDKDTEVQKVAMFLLISTILAEDILRTLTFLSEAEGQLVSIERITFFAQVPTEKNYKSFQQEFKKLLVVPNKINLRSLTLPPSTGIVKQGEVVFENVTARYGEDSEPVLKNLTFTVKPGEKIGIVGRTGAGKSSLIKLFWMSLAPSEGRVLVDGVDVTKQDLKSLRNEVMVVSQDTALFQGSLAENIDPNMTEAEYPQAMQVLHELGIKNKNVIEKEMDCKVDADGSNFSQGEKQIICYARTLVNKKKLIILDEATANIDVKTEQAIKKIQESKFADSTMFIIAHRLKTVLHCDRIMVLKFGRIVEFDSPQKLLEDPNGLFRDMYNKMMEQGMDE